MKFRAKPGSLGSGNNGTGGLDTVTTLNTISDSSNSWNYDALGNQTSTQGGSQTRTFNAQNQIASISGLTTPTYDNNGNMTTDQAGVTYKYDAWNRMVYASSNPTQSFRYDALNREIEYWTSGSDSFYSANWQLLEDDVSSTSKLTYVWGARGIDDLIARDQQFGGARIYAQQDANNNVTAITGAAGNVLERFVYDPYGSVTVLSSGWAATTDSYSWTILFQAGRFNGPTGLYLMRNRMYNPTTGTWMQQDPTGTQYVDGDNLYQFVQSNPASAVDPLGLSLTFPGFNQGTNKRQKISLSAFFTYVANLWRSASRNFILNHQWGGTTLSTGVHPTWDEQTAQATQRVTTLANGCIEVQRVYNSQGEIMSSVNELVNDLPRSDWRYLIGQLIVARFNKMAFEHEGMHVENYESHYNDPILAVGTGCTLADAEFAAVMNFESERRRRDQLFDDEKHQIDINGDREWGALMLYAISFLLISRGIVL